MAEFAAALLVFLAAHSLPAATGLRGRLMTRFGRRAYLTVYSLVSVAVLIWLIAMAPACLLFVAGLARPNPLSVSFRGGATPANAPGVLSLTRHPILWAFFLWAGAHAVANGDVVGLIMFGGFAAFSLAGMRIMVARARRTLPAAEFAAAWAVADGTIGARLRRAWSGRTALELAADTALYAGALAAHGPVIGIDPLAAF